MVVALRHVTDLCCGQVCLAEQAEGFSGHLGLLWSCCSALWEVEVKIVNGFLSRADFILGAFPLFACARSIVLFEKLRSGLWVGVTVDSVCLACQKPCVPSHHRISLA